MAQNRKYFSVFDESLLPAQDVKVTVNGVEIVYQANYGYLVDDSITFPYEVTLEKVGYPPLRYPKILHLPDRFYIIPEGYGSYWEENIRVPFERLDQWAAVILSGKGRSHPEEVAAFLQSTGISESEEFYPIAEQKLGERGIGPTWTALIIHKNNGERFGDTDEVFAKLRESDFIEKAGPLLGYNFFLTDGIGVRFYDQNEAEATAVLERALGKEIEYKPYGGIYRQVDALPNLGVDLLQLVQSLQGERVFLTVSVLKEGLYWELD